MKILHVVPTYLPAVRYGGPIFAVHGLARALGSIGNDVQVFTTNVDGAGTSNVPVGEPVMLDGVAVTYFRSPFPRLYWSPEMSRALREAARDADVIHAHSVFLWPTTAAARAARAADTPFIITPRGMLVPELLAAKSALVKRAWIELFEKRNLRHAAGVHFTSERESEDAARAGLLMPTSFVIPNGIEAVPVRSVERHPRRVAYLGRISWKKRINLLIEAMKHVDGELVIAGNDEEGLTPHLREQATRFGVADRITWTGPLDSDLKFELLASSAVFCLPSISENFGNVVLEALSQETPAVLTAGVGLASELSREGAAVTAEESAEALGAQISRLMDSPDVARRMGETGRRLIEQRFSWTAVATQMQSQYERMIAGDLPK